MSERIQKEAKNTGNANLVKRKFVGIRHSGQYKGHIDIIYLETERSKPFSAVTKLLEERGFNVAHEVLPNCTPKNITRKAREPNFYPLTEPALVQ